MSSNTRLLDIQDWRVSFPRGGGLAAAVKGVSLSVGAGETLGIVGESGSGKSVTVMSIFGLVSSPPAVVRGRAQFRGDELTHLPERRLQQLRGRDVGFIFQDPATALNPVIRVGRQIREALWSHNRDAPPHKHDARVLELLEMVGIEPAARRARQFPFELSGGMRQRVVVAMAIANNPSLLIADEPTTALDVTIQAQIMELLKTAKAATGAAAILISHDLGLVGQNSNRIAVMYAGRIVEQGAVRDLFAEPRHPYTVGLLECLPDLKSPQDRLPSIRGQAPDPADEIEGCAFRSRCIVGRSMDICRMESPPLSPDESGRLVACHFPGSLSRTTSMQDVTIHSSDPRFSTERTSDGAEPDEIVRLEGLTVQFSVRSADSGDESLLTAVDGVDMHIRSGETLGLVGESGCGKTTLARTIVGLNQPIAGRILFQGTDITHLKRSELRGHRRHMQIVFQDPFSSLNPKFKVRRILEEPLRIHGLVRGDLDDRIARLLELVGLQPSDARRYPHEFSGGQRQRIAIARALTLEPELLILDEAVSALDVSIQAQILNLLKDLQDQMGHAYLFVSHDLGVVSQISDRVAVMYLGQVVEEGARDRILTNPKHPYTKALLSAVPTVAEERPNPRLIMAGGMPNPLDPPSGCRFRTRCWKATDYCATVAPALSVHQVGTEDTVACHFPVEDGDIQVIREGSNPA